MQSKNYLHLQILKKLRSFMGSVHQLGKFIPNLSQLCFPLRPLLKQNTKFLWTDEHEEQFKLIKAKIAETTENKHFNPDLETRIKCDASRKGLGCALEQRTANGWHTVAFASRFWNSVEDRYSINELESRCCLVYRTFQILFIRQTIHRKNWS